MNLECNLRMWGYFHKNGSLFFNEKANHVNRHWIADELISQEDPKENGTKNIKLVPYRYHRIDL